MRRYKKNHNLIGLIAGPIVFIMIIVFPGRISIAEADLTKKVNLTGIPEPGTQYYRMTTEVIAIEMDGKREAPEISDVWIEYTSKPQGTGNIVVCRGFTLRSGASSTVELPALKNWTYTSRRGTDERGLIFGIDQSKFEGMMDEKGNALPENKTYPVFNTFVDFHSVIQVIAERTKTGKGIQDLHAIGDKIVHESANTEAPVSLSTMVEKGSYFRNGNITLELKGLSMVGERQCALIGVDSGDCRLKMIMQPMPQVKIETHGGSYGFGEFCVDLKTQWVQKATIIETVVSETSGAMLPQKLQSIHKRHILLRCLSREEFLKSLPGK